MVRVGHSSRYPTIARIAYTALMLVSVVFLTSCNSAIVTSNSTDIDVVDKVRSLDILPRQPQQVGVNQVRPAQPSRSAEYEGTVVSDVSEDRPQPVANGGGFDLNFENTPVATVAKVVLGDIMGTGYTIDPRVQGTRQPRLRPARSEVRHYIRA